MAGDALIILMKLPQSGRVKTRLARAIGAEEALAAYRLLLNRTRRIARQVDADRLLYCSPRIDPEDAWPAAAFQKRRQAPGDIGARMHHALRETLRDHDRAVLIGSDNATLDAPTLRSAFAALHTHDCVVGPARDGGYYLIGLTRPQPQLFRDIPWSSEQTYAATLSRIEDLGLRCQVLPVHADIDTGADWEEFGERLRAGH